MRVYYTNHHSNTTYCITVATNKDMQLKIKKSWGTDNHWSLLASYGSLAMARSQLFEFL